MSHFDRSRWTDFARGLVGEEERAAMRFHLDTGCPTCACRLAVQRSVAALADADRRLEVPDHAVRQIKGFFALNRPRRRARLAPLELALRGDSRLEAARAGSRGEAEGERVMRYYGDGYAVDLRLEPAGAAGETHLTGVVTERGGAPAGPVVAHLVMGDRVVGQTLSDDAGRFELATCQRATAELWLEVRPGRHLSVTVDLAN